MFKRVICAIGLTLVFVSLTSANTAQWIGAGYSDTAGAWEDGSNWSTGSAPILTDNPVRAYRSDNAAGSNITIGSDVSGGVKLQMKYGKSKITINNGGTLTNTDGVEMYGSLITDTSEVDILAGGTWSADTSIGSEGFLLTSQGPSHDTVNVWGTLNVDGTNNPQLTIGTTTNVNGYGTLNIYGGGVVYADRYSVGSRGVINIYGMGVGSGLLKIKGDKTAQVSTDAGAGRIVCVDSTLTWMFDGTNTIVWNVPEPATMALLGLGGLLLRRKN